MLAQQKSICNKTPFIEDRFSMVVGFEDDDQYDNMSDQYYREGLQEIINLKVPQKVHIDNQWVPRIMWQFSPCNSPDPKDR
eukprot:1266178-Ditylum_brightwellii.AAC.1